MIMKAPKLGILSLDTAFPRIAGDVGTPETYPFAVEIQVVSGADSTEIVQDKPPSSALVDRFIEAARSLEANGATALVSTCGFLVSVQDVIARSVSIPVMLSALSLYPLVQVTCPGRVGILTASKKALGSQALAAAGIEEQAIRIAGMDHSTLFQNTFLTSRQNQNKQFNRTAMQDAVVETACGLATQGPALSAIILECGNLPPYAAAIRERTGLPVFHLADAARSLVHC
jgi:aspartate/glutamate racemase